MDNGITPDLVIGDLDSLDKSYQETLDRQGISMDVYPVEKDATDLELALQKAAAKMPSAITIIGAFGTRWDHSLINLHLMAKFTREDMAVCLLDEGNTARAVVPGCWLNFSGRAGDFVSLIPLTPIVKGVQTKGLAYALQDAKLAFGSSLPVSNRLSGQVGSVFIAEGKLLLLHYYDKFTVNFDF